MILRAEIAQRVFNSLLMVHPGKAAAAMLAIGGRIVEGGVEISGIEAVHHVAFENGRPSESMGKIGKQLERAFEQFGEMPFDMVEGIAVIPVEGTLVHKGTYVGMSSGRTSYQGLQTQVALAMKSQAVKGVVFEVDSFGGEVAGAFQTAEMISALSAMKPTLAILTDNALSAGYLMASAARQIVMPEEGRAGSIGVITMHVDYSRKLENEGIKVTILAAGKHKADGNMFQVLPEALATRIRGEIEQARMRFAEAVGRYRKKRFIAEQAMATEADDFRAVDSVRLGLADAVGDTHEAFAAFVAEINRKR